MIGSRLRCKEERSDTMTGRIRKLLLVRGYKEVQVTYYSVYIKQQKDGFRVLRLLDERDPILANADQIISDENKISELLREHLSGQVEYTNIIMVSDIISEQVRSLVQEPVHVIVLSSLEKKAMLFDCQFEERKDVEQELNELMLDKDGIKTYWRSQIKHYIAPVTVVLFLINVVVHVLLSCLGDVYDGEFMYQHGASSFLDVLNKRQYWRLFTSMFLHFGVQHLAGNMIALLFLGGMLERRIGSVRYLAIYILSGMCGGVISCLYEYYQYSNHLIMGDTLSVSAGASGAVFGIIGALIFIVIFHRKKEEEINLRQLAWMALFSVLSGVLTTGIDNAAHIGGLIFGFLFAYLLAHRR